MNNEMMGLYMAALARVLDRHELAETNRNADWAGVGRVFSEYLTGDLDTRETRAILINVQ